MLILPVTSCSSEDFDVIKIDNSTHQIGDVRNGILATQPDQSRELVNVGYDEKGANIILVHQIGEMREIFLSWVTIGQKYDGVAEDKISYSRSVAVEEAQVYEQTYGLSLSVGAELGYSQEIHVVATFETTWSFETTYGRSFAKTVEDAGTHEFSLTPKRGSGFYAIGIFGMCAVYQVSTISIITKEVVSSTMFISASKQMSLNYYALVKAEKISDFNLVDTIENMQYNLPAISTMSDIEIEDAINFARQNAKLDFSLVYGNDFTAFNGITTWWTDYVKLDTLNANEDEYIFNTEDNGSEINLDVMKAFGMQYCDIALRYSFDANGLNNIRIQIKIVNKTTGGQIGETEEHIPSGEFSCKLPFSFFQSSADNIIIEIRARRNFMTIGDMRIKKDRNYNVVFSH